MNHVSVGWTYECTDQWKFLRTLCRTELFGTKVIESQSSLREQKVNELVQFLISKEMEEVKIAEIVFISVFNFLGNIFFSKNFINYDVENGGGMSGLIREIVELWTTPNISDLYPILGGLDLQGLSKMAHMCFAKYAVHGKELSKKEERINTKIQQGRKTSWMCCCIMISQMIR
ncbi:hypothetical protein ACH5RR_001737 [Cinchona calisaya]|uniref:Cytochrome P450 n=1 Tax=Cinchona calisaya TaxID=153742 RepID=A0ABD3B4W5_9GENT